MDEYWLRFTQSGRIEDYLNYKKQEKAENDADKDEGYHYKRTDDRRE